MTTAQDTEWELKVLQDILKEIGPDLKVTFISGIQPTPNDMYGFWIQNKDIKTKLVISWEALISARNSPSYKNGEFRKFLSLVVSEITEGRATKLSYVLTKRGLRKESEEKDVETLKIYGALEEAAKIGDEFFAKHGKSS